MKRKFDEACATSYTEARSLVFNISLGKLHSNSPKPVEPSLWRSLLIVKTLHRIAEELKIEASSAVEPAATNKAVEEVLEDQQLSTLFYLQNSPVAVLLPESENGASAELSSDNGAMQTDDVGDSPMPTVFGACAPPNSDIADVQVPFMIGGSSYSYKQSENSADGAVAEVTAACDNFPEIDCACLESFPSNDLSDINVSLDPDLLGSQASLSYSAFGSAYTDFQGYGSISELDCLMQVLEEECV